MIAAAIAVPWAILIVVATVYLRLIHLRRVSRVRADRALVSAERIVRLCKLRSAVSEC